MVARDAAMLLGSGSCFILTGRYAGPKNKLYGTCYECGVPIPSSYTSLQGVRCLGARLCMKRGARHHLATNHSSCCWCWAGNLFSPFCGSLAVSGLQVLCGRYQLPRLRERQAALLRELKVTTCERRSVFLVPPQQR